MLLDRQANIEARNSTKSTALHIAAEAESSEIISLLLDRGANVNVFEADGSSPLHVAVSNGNYEMAVFLISRGADPRTLKNKLRSSSLTPKIAKLLSFSIQKAESKAKLTRQIFSAATDEKVENATLSDNHIKELENEETDKTQSKYWKRSQVRWSSVLFKFSIFIPKLAFIHQKHGAEYLYRNTLLTNTVTTFLQLKG